MPDLGDKVGDVYIEVHADMDKRALDRTEAQLNKYASRVQKDLNKKLGTDFTRQIDATLKSAAKSEFAAQNRTIQALERQRQKSIKENEKAQAESIKRNSARVRNAEEAIQRAHIEALKMAESEEKRIERDRINRILKNKKRYKDGGKANTGELFENVISILPGQLEKVFRDPKVAAAVIAGGTTLGSFLLSSLGGALGAGGGLAAMFGGVFAAISASPELQERGKEMGVTIISGIQQSALNQLGPAISDAFDQLQGSNFETRTVGTFNRIFASMKDNLVPFVADVDGALDSVLSGFETLAAGADPYLDQLGYGLGLVGDSVGDLFRDLALHGPELADALGDALEFTANLVDGFSNLVIKASEFWQIAKDIKNLDLGDAYNGLKKINEESAMKNNDPWWKDLLTGDFGGGGDKAYAEIQRRRGEIEKTTQASKDAEHANYNAQRTQALANDSVRDATGLTKAQKDAQKKATQEMKLYTDAVDKAVSANKTYNDQVSNALRDQLDWANGIARVKEEFKGQNDSISLNTEHGRKNRGVILDQIEAARDQAQAVLESTGSAKKADEKFKSLTGKILDATGATGKNKDEIQKLIDKYKGFQDLPIKPKEIKVKIDPGDYNAVRFTLENLTKDERKTIFVQAKRSGAPISEIISNIDKNTGNGNGRASGGPISGPGTGTSDSIPMNLSNGEFVIKASSARAIGMSTLSRMNSTGRIPGAMASGGRVGYGPVNTHGRGASAKEKAAYEALLKQIASLNKTISIQTKAMEKYNNQLAASKEQFKSFVNLGALDTQGKTTGDILQQLQQRKAKAGTFQKQLGALRKKGLSGQALQQIAEAGPDSDIAKLVLGGSAYDINMINGLLGGAGAYSEGIADAIFPSGKKNKAALAANKKKLAAKRKAAKKLKPVRAHGATISYAGGRISALFSAKELQQQQLQAGTYVTVMIDGKEVRALVKQEQAKVTKKSNRQMKSGRK